MEKLFKTVSPDKLAKKFKQYGIRMVQLKIIPSKNETNEKNTNGKTNPFSFAYRPGEINFHT